jgi:hypothetical protein
MRFNVQQWLTPPSGEATPYLYDLTSRSAGVIPPQSQTVRPAALATVTENFYAAAPSSASTDPDAWFPSEMVGAAPAGFRFSVPGRLVDYFTGDPSVVWRDDYGSGSGQEQDSGAIYRPGERLTDDWGRYPLHAVPDVSLLGALAPVPILTSASRAGNVLSLDMNPFTDSTPGHASGGFQLPASGAKVAGRYEIDENGRNIAGGNAAHWGVVGPRVTLSPRLSVIRFVLTASQTGKRYPLSTSARTVWTWRSSHEAGTTLPKGWGCLSLAEPPTRQCAVEPLMTLGYQVTGLALDGSARPGRQVLEVTAGHLPLAKAAPVARVTVQVSYDGGKTWHSATVTGSGGHYRAVYTAPTDRYVMLRTAAADTAGGQINETITRAYRTGS